MFVFCHPQRTIALAKIKKEHRVLELGCGAGRIILPLVRQFPKISVVGVDLQAKMLKKCRNRILREAPGSRIKLLKSDIRKLKPNSIGRFDRILVFTVLGEIPQPEQVVDKIKSMLEPGGLVSITEVLPDPCYVSQKKLLRLFNGAGFLLRDSFQNMVSYTCNFELR